MDMKFEALKLAAKSGFCIFPVSPPFSGGPSAGKRPLIRDWPELATNDPGTIAAWWNTYPDANIGVATGKKSNVFVLDVDVKSDGFASLQKLMNEVGNWPETLTARTGSGGLHAYFKYGDLNIRNSASVVGPGLDIRGEGGFVVAPPSLHACGSRYEWIA